MHCTNVLGTQQELLHFCKVCVLFCAWLVDLFFLLLVFETGSGFIAQALAM